MDRSKAWAGAGDDEPPHPVEVIVAELPGVFLPVTLIEGPFAFACAVLELACVHGALLA